MSHRHQRKESGGYWGVPFRGVLPTTEAPLALTAPRAAMCCHPLSQPDHRLPRHPAGSLEENTLEVALHDE